MAQQVPEALPPDRALPYVLVAVAPGVELHWPGDEAAPELRRLAPGAPFTVPEVLFRKVTDDEVASWRERFGGPDDV